MIPLGGGPRVNKSFEIGSFDSAGTFFKTLTKRIKQARVQLILTGKLATNVLGFVIEH